MLWNDSLQFYGNFNLSRLLGLDGGLHSLSASICYVGLKIFFCRRGFLYATAEIDFSLHVGLMVKYLKCETSKMYLTIKS